MRLVALALVALSAALAGCGSEEQAAAPQPTAPSQPPTLERNALPELQARARTLNLDLLAGDSFRPGELAAVLEEARYVVGSEREFYGSSPTFHHVVARALRFEDVDGAESYLVWLGQHPDEFLGRSQRETAAPLGESGILFSLLRCDVCKKQQPTFLAAWRHGETVAFLLAAGPGVNRETFDTLARELDERIAP